MLSFVPILHRFIYVFVFFRQRLGKLIMFLRLITCIKLRLTRCRYSIREMLELLGVFSVGKF